MLHYIIETSLCISALYLAYLFFWRNEYSHRAKRWFLMFSLLVSLILPLFHVPISLGEENSLSQANSEQLESVYWGDLLPQSTAIGMNKVQNNNYLIYLYLGGVLAFLLRYTYSLMHFYRLITKHKVQKQNGMNLVLWNESYSPFSFFRYVFINPKLIKSNAYDCILKHEEVHVNQLHSIDVLLTELFLVLNWFNPFVYSFRKAVLENHEYLADQGVLDSGLAFENYRMSILMSHQSPVYSQLASRFSLKLTKKRLKMMTHNSKSIRSIYTRLALVVPVLIALFYFVSCENATNTEVKPEEPVAQEKSQNATESVEKFERLTLSKFALNTKSALQATVDMKAGNKYQFGLRPKQELFNEDFYVTTADSDERIPTKIRKSKEVYYVEIECTESGNYKAWVNPAKVLDGDDLDFMEFSMKGDSEIEIQKITDSDMNQPEDEVFFIVEEMPKFQGKGQMAFQKYLSEKLKLPADYSGQEGRVYLQMVIDEEGKVGKVKVIRGLNEVADKIAFDLVSNSPDWTPGKQRGKTVKVAFTFPVVIAK